MQQRYLKKVAEVGIMKIKIISISRQEEDFIKDGCKYYESKLKHYCSFSFKILKAPKESNRLLQLKSEWQLIKKELSDNETVVMMDENGKSITSVALSEYLTAAQNKSTRSMSFLIGGAYGFDEEAYKRANLKLSLSEMTLPHQLAKLVLTEQLYRAFTIMKNEKYHHI